MWNNMDMKPMKIEDITAEKILEIEEYAQGVRLEKLTVAQLKDLAKDKGIAGISAMKKADLIEAIKNV